MLYIVCFLVHVILVTVVKVRVTQNMIHLVTDNELVSHELIKWKKGQLIGKVTKGRVCSC